MTSRDRTMLGVVAALATLAAFWFLVLSPQRKDAAALDTQISQAQRQIASAQSTIASSQAAVQTYNASSAVLAQLGKALPSDPQVPSLVYEVSSAARTEHVDFQGLDAKGLTGASAGAAPAAATGATTTLPGGIQPLPFSFTFTGDFFHLSAFFQRLDALVLNRGQRMTVSGRLLTIDGLNLAPAPNGFPSMTATVQATSYLQPSQGVPAVPAASPPAGTVTAPAGSSGSPALPHLPAATMAAAP